MSKQITVARRRSPGRKVVLVAGLVVLTLGAIIFAARPGPAASPPAARVEARTDRSLVANPSSFDFGEISMAAGKVAHRYWIRNTGAAPIVIRKLYTSCMCTTAALVKAGRKFEPSGMPGHGLIKSIDEPIAPDEAAMIEVVFDPAAHGPGGIGRIERTVTVQTDLEPPLELALAATVKP